MPQKPPKTDSLRILAVDDSPATLEVIRRNLLADGHQVHTSGSVEEAVDLMETTPLDLVITDFKMPKASGMDLIRHVRENYRDVEIIMITGYPCIGGAVQAIKDGAEDYLAKPFTDDELLAVVHRMAEKIRIRRITVSDAIPPERFGIIGESREMREVFLLIEKAAAAPANVLICGESGTGKELVARAIHYNSPRRGAPFVSVNCAALPDNLLESELFGHVSGAFTGARGPREGFFQIADGGTLFLDEIGDASLSLQGQLLRVIENGEIYMVGSSRVQKVNTRIVAATHKDLASLVRQGTFREDLFYRLNIIEIRIPSLRERASDIIPLIHFFTAKFAREANRPVPNYTDQALSALRRHQWQGNVRELENLVQRLLVVAEGEVIDVADLPAHMRFSVTRAKGGNRTLSEVEAEHVIAVLNSVDGNKTKAAEILGIDRKTLREKARKAGYPI